MPNNPNFADNLKPVTSSDEAKKRGRNGGINRRCYEVQAART